MRGDVQPWMVREAEEEARLEARRNPDGHPDDHAYEAAVTVAVDAFPGAPHEEQMEAARAIKSRMSTGGQSGSRRDDLGFRFGEGEGGWL